MNSGYYPKVENPNSTNNNIQMKSGEFQTPFFFGGSQIPTDLNISPQTFNGSGAGRKMKPAVMPNENPVRIDKKSMPLYLPFKK
jgi:hypothetical protein